MITKLIEWLHSQGVAVRIDPQTALYAGGVAGTPREEVPDNCEMVIVLGGDGTLLAAAGEDGALPREASRAVMSSPASPKMATG